MAAPRASAYAVGVERPVAGDGEGLASHYGNGGAATVGGVGLGNFSSGGGGSGQRAAMSSPRLRSTGGITGAVRDEPPAQMSLTNPGEAEGGRSWGTIMTSLDGLSVGSVAASTVLLLLAAVVYLASNGSFWAGLVLAILNCGVPVAGLVAVRGPGLSTTSRTLVVGYRVAAIGAAALAMIVLVVIPGQM